MHNNNVECLRIFCFIFLDSHIYYITKFQQCNVYTVPFSIAKTDFDLERQFHLEDESSDVKYYDVCVSRIGVYRVNC